MDDAKIEAMRRRARELIERDPVQALANIATALAVGDVEEVEAENAALRTRAEASERALGELREAAGNVQQWLDEAIECPICGNDGCSLNPTENNHVAGDRCAALSAALTAHLARVERPEAVEAEAALAKLHEQATVAIDFAEARFPMHSPVDTKDWRDMLVHVVHLARNGVSAKVATAYTARVKAEALREAAKAWDAGVARDGLGLAHWLRSRADSLEAPRVEPPKETP